MGFVLIVVGLQFDIFAFFFEFVFEVKIVGRRRVVVVAFIVL